MSLTQTQAQILANVRQFADAAGTTALQRHANANVYDYINRALGSLHRKLTEAGLGDRYLSSTTMSLTSGTATYSLPATFDHLISVDLTANGTKTWLVAYEMHERPALTDPASTFSGTPICYRLRGSNIEYLPTPGSSYSSVIWYVPTPTSWATDGTDASSTFDTINRLDEYLVAYASRLIAVKDKKWDLVGQCKALMEEIGDEIASIGHARDRNSPPRPVDEMMHDRFGRRRLIPRRWR